MLAISHRTFALQTRCVTRSLLCSHDEFDSLGLDDDFGKPLRHYLKTNKYLPYVPDCGGFEDKRAFFLEAFMRIVSFLVSGHTQDRTRC